MTVRILAQQSQIVHQKNDSVIFWQCQLLTAPAHFFCAWWRRRLWKNTLTGYGCCWHAQHGLCHRTKDRITGLMLCVSTCWTRWAAYRRLCHVLVELQLHSVSLSCHHVGRSRSANRITLRLSCAQLVGKMVAHMQDAATGAWAKLLYVQWAQNFWADDQTVREFKGDLLALQ